MAKIQARNVDDALYQRIEQSAMKHERSLEGEIRIALQAYYQPEVKEEALTSGRERWQHETGQRLKWLLDRLTADNYFREFAGGRPMDTGDLVRLARRLDTSPGLLMDIMEGRQELTFSFADAIAHNVDASADWLLGGSGAPFPVVRMSNRGWQEFFLPDGVDTGYTFELIRISGGRHEGTLFCLRICQKTGRIALGVVTEAFYLAPGMGGGGHGHLTAFLIFLKTRGARLPVNTFEWQPAAESFDIWTVLGHHHPVFFQNSGSRRTAGWLQQLFSGEDPGAWYEGWSSDLKKIAETPSGDGSHAVSQLAPL